MMVKNVMDRKSMLKRINGNKGLFPLGTPNLFNGNKGLFPLGTPNLFNGNKGLCPLGTQTKYLM